MSKKYKVIGSFGYRGVDGKNNKPIIIAPGEDVPKVDSNERERLLRSGKIAEVSQETGEIIIHKNPEDLNATQVENLMRKPPAFIGSFLTARQNSKFPLSKETLSKMYTMAEERHSPAALIKKIEEFLT